MSTSNPYTSKERFTVEQARAAEGCWFDSHRGQYIGEAVINAAETFGFEADKEQSTVDAEHYLEEYEAAENYLNANIAPEGYFFGTSEASDWGLWKSEEPDEEQPEWLENETVEERAIRMIGPRCDQCTAASINGVFCHEHGCPNQHKVWDITDQRWVDEEPDEVEDFEYERENDFMDDYEFDLGE